VGFNPDNPVHALIHEITEPILAPIRSVVPRLGMIDLSAMVAIFLLFILFRIASQL
jgi:YggT family protein